MAARGEVREENPPTVRIHHGKKRVVEAPTPTDLYKILYIVHRDKRRAPSRSRRTLAALFFGSPVQGELAWNTPEGLYLCHVTIPPSAMMFPARETH